MGLRYLFLLLRSQLETLTPKILCIGSRAGKKGIISCKVFLCLRLDGLSGYGGLHPRSRNFDCASATPGENRLLPSGSSEDFWVGPRAGLGLCDYRRLPILPGTLTCNHPSLVQLFCPLSSPSFAYNIGYRYYMRDSS